MGFFHSPIAQVVERFHHAVTILLGHSGIQFLSYWRKVDVALVSVVGIGHRLARSGINVPRREAHGLEHEVVLHIVFLDFTQLNQFVGQFLPLAVLPEQRNNSQQQYPYKEHP